MGNRAWGMGKKLAMPNSQFSIPNSQCPMPNAQCPIQSINVSQSKSDAT
ncbi:MAG: hypothetical protein V7K98_02535 [Nostoc sp.]